MGINGDPAHSHARPSGSLHRLLFPLDCGLRKCGVTRDHQNAGITLALDDTTLITIFILLWFVKKKPDYTDPEITFRIFASPHSSALYVFPLGPNLSYPVYENGSINNVSSATARVMEDPEETFLNALNIVSYKQNRIFKNKRM